MKLNWNKLHEIQEKENNFFSDENMEGSEMSFASDLLPGNFLVVKMKNLYTLWQLTSDYTVTCYVDKPNDFKTIKAAKAYAATLVPKTDEQLIKEREETDKEIHDLLDSLLKMIDAAGLREEYEKELAKNERKR